MLKCREKMEPDPWGRGREQGVAWGEAAMVVVPEWGRPGAPEGIRPGPRRDLRVPPMWGHSAAQSGHSLLSGELSPVRRRDDPATMTL